MNPFLEAALSYTARGWPVFPVHGVTDGTCMCGNPNCEHPGKHPCTPRGVLDATLEPSRIREFWRKNHGAGVAIATGQLSGLLVIDIDPRNGGSENLFELERAHGELPKTITSLTGGGGSHLFFQSVDGVKNQSSRIAPGIDVKSNGGYIIAPPSSHAAGRCYRWADDLGPDKIALAACPEWLVELLQRAPSRRFIPKGQRNGHLASLAGSLRREGMAADQMEIRLHEINEDVCQPPLSREEVSRIANSIAKYAAGKGQTDDDSPNVTQWPAPLAPQAYYGIAGDFVRI